MLSGPLEPLFNATEMVDRIEIVAPEPLVRVTLFMRDHEIEFSDRLLDTERPIKIFGNLQGATFQPADQKLPPAASIPDMFMLTIVTS